MPPKKFSISAILQYDAEILEAFIQMLEAVVDSIATNENMRFFLKIAVNELVVNAVEHGYNKLGGPVTVYLLRLPDAIVLEVSDCGIGIHPELLNLEKVIKGMDDLTIRGWGLSILKKVSSSFMIRPNEPNGTIISMTMPL
jgi:stage II sporulation protein AB (anti-sigma F factor)